jgi:hypothetical protein
MYQITEEQYETILHTTKTLEFTADTIKDLCNGEKDDIVYGFELGQIFRNLRNWLPELLELEENLNRQKREKKV